MVLAIELRHRLIERDRRARSLLRRGRRPREQHEQLQCGSRGFVAQRRRDLGDETRVGMAYDRETEDSEYSWGSGLVPNGFEDAQPAEGGRYKGKTPQETIPWIGVGRSM